MDAVANAATNLVPALRLLSRPTAFIQLPGHAQITRTFTSKAFMEAHAYDPEGGIVLPFVGDDNFTLEILHVGRTPNQCSLASLGTVSRTVQEVYQIIECGRQFGWRDFPYPIIDTGNFWQVEKILSGGIICLRNQERRVIRLSSDPVLGATIYVGWDGVSAALTQGITIDLQGNITPAGYQLKFLYKAMKGLWTYLRSTENGRGQSDPVGMTPSELAWKTARRIWQSGMYGEDELGAIGIRIGTEQEDAWVYLDKRSQWPQGFQGLRGETEDQGKMEVSAIRITASSIEPDARKPILVHINVDPEYLTIETRSPNNQSPQKKLAGFLQDGARQYIYGKDD